MTKVLYNGEYIDLCDELEPGYKELDILTDIDEDKRDLEDTMEMKSINLDDTLEFKIRDLNDTQELDLGEINGE